MGGSKILYAEFQVKRCASSKRGVWPAAVDADGNGSFDSPHLYVVLYVVRADPCELPPVKLRLTSNR